MQKEKDDLFRGEAYVREKGRYLNPHVRDVKRTLFDVVLWKMGYYDDREVPKAVPHDFSYPLPPQQVNPNVPSAMWINHSTFFIKLFGIHILTDPIWSKRCSPFPFFGPVRKHQPPLSLESLGHVDYVLISHNHYDHLDKATVLKLHQLYPQIRWCVPTGVKDWFTKMGIETVEEMGWWQSHVFSLPVEPKARFKVTAVPAQHFSGRGLGDLNKTLWVGWVVEYSDPQHQKRFYFVGDTGYNAVDFKAIGEEWKNMDLSLIPIGTYMPRKFMSPVHIEPYHAIEIHKSVGSKLSIAMHWKTFRLSDENMNQPPYDLYTLLNQQGIDPLSFLALPPGYEINW